MLYTGNEHIDSKEPFMAIRNEYMKGLNREIDLILLGDSITEGFNLSIFYPATKCIVNSGMSGDRIVNLEKRLERDVFDFKPSQVLLNIGINDLMHFEHDSVEGLDERIYSLYQKYIRIVELILEHDIRLCCTSIIKIAEQPYDELKHHFANYMFINYQIELLNSKIKYYCNEHKIKYLDYNSALTNKYNQLDESYAYDGLHLNQKGYFEIVQILVKEGVL